MKRHTKRGHKGAFGLLAVLSVLGVYIAWAFLRPLPLLQPSNIKTLSIPAAPSKLQWPSAQAAVAVMDSPILETHGIQTPAPIASTAKVITALTVLDKKPFTPGQQGPTITLSDADVAIYNNYAAQDGSLVPVAAGEQISEYQMLQAIMLPSANNMADSLAIWAFGSLSNYAVAANAFLAAHNLKSSHVGSDASGFSPSTTSTAEDLTRLGLLAMKHPVISTIVGQQTAAGIPLTTTLKNVNFLLGTSNIIGIKTGNTDEAGGVFISASRIMLENKPVTIVTTVVGSATLFSALKESLSLVDSAQKNFSPIQVIAKDSVVAQYRTIDTQTLKAIVAKDTTIHTWNGATSTAAVDMAPITYKTPKNQQVGQILIKTSFGKRVGMPIILQKMPHAPSVMWRLQHPF